MINVQQFFAELVDANKYILADGALGTNLFELGLTTGDAPELWNVDQPEKVAQVHRSFIDVGANMINTNSFGGSSYRLALHNSQHRVDELNEMAAQLVAEEIEKSGRDDVIIAGSIGPSGEILAPNGAATIDEVAQAFTAQAIALKKGGAHILLAETMSSKEEVIAASIAADKANIDFAVTLTFDSNGKTMMGLHPDQLLSLVDSMACKPLAIGLNCGRSPYESMVSLYHITHNMARDDIYIMAKANRGIPVYKNGQFMFDGTPEIMASYANIAYDLGAHIIGGCCGTDAATLGHIRHALQHKDYSNQHSPSLDDIYDAIGQGQDILTIENKKKRTNRR